MTRRVRVDASGCLSLLVGLVLAVACLWALSWLVVNWP
jgi:hypothetical protein